MTSTGKACNSSRRMIYVASARKKMHSLANMSRNRASPTRSEQRPRAPELREAHGKRQNSEKYRVEEQKKIKKKRKPGKLIGTLAAI